jgi:PAS domain S-box-containing protein
MEEYGGLSFSGRTELALEIKALQKQLAETEASLRREMDRAELLTSEINRMRSSESSGTVRNRATVEEEVVVPRSTLDLLHLKERAMDAAKEGITIADARAPDMPLIYVNEGFSRITGYPVDFTLGKNCRFLQGPATDAATVKKLRDAMVSGQPCVVQITNYRRSGDPFINYLSLTPIHDPSGVLTHYVGVQSDITELVRRRQAELAAKHAAAEAAAATEAKSQFLARMSHEIRTPLNGMIAVGQLLAETKLTPAQWDLVNTIRCSGEALLTLITDILDFSKIEANKMVLSNVSFLLETTIEASMEIAGLYAARKWLQFAYYIAPDVPRRIRGDPQRLQQILLNILNNALKFTDVGEVLLEVWVVRGIHTNSPVVGCGGICCEQGESEETVEIHFSVRDTGIGISGADVLRLFKSFSQVDASPTRRFGGSGLGLAISQKLTEAMGGRMWAESAGLGRGSTFRWFIRVKAENDEFCCDSDVVSNNKVEQLQQLQPKVESGRRILLIEPCDMVRQVLLLVLRRWGYSVAAVNSERAGLARLSLDVDDGVDDGVNNPVKHDSSTPSHSKRTSRLNLKHAVGTEDIRDSQAASAACNGPYDVVIMDVGHEAVLHALLEQATWDEARRIVFLGWPGAKDPEEGFVDEGDEEQKGQQLLGQQPPRLPHMIGTSNGMLCDILAKEKAQDQYQVIPEEQKRISKVEQEMEEKSKTKSKKQLCYVVVSRPVRQGRLKLALQELFAADLGAADDIEGANEQTSSMRAPPALLGPNEPETCDTASDTSDQKSRSESSGGGSVLQVRQQRLKRASSAGTTSSMGVPPPPAAPSASASASASAAAAAGHHYGTLSSQKSIRENATRKLLIAEDNAINMKVALGILRRLGFSDVVSATDGVEAVEAVAAAGGPAAFSAILMDLHMPKKGGIEAVQDIRRAWPNQQTQIIAVTADAFEDTRDACIAQGFTGWLAKPFRLEEFARIMGEG